LEYIEKLSYRCILLDALVQCLPNFFGWRHTFDTPKNFYSSKFIKKPLKIWVSWPFFKDKSGKIGHFWPFWKNLATHLEYLATHQCVWVRFSIPFCLIFYIYEPMKKIFIFHPSSNFHSSSSSISSAPVSFHWKSFSNYFPLITHGTWIAQANSTKNGRWK
jgi:hypothetical protein